MPRQTARGTRAQMRGASVANRECGSRNGGRRMPDATTTIAELKEEVRRFAAERRWERYHNPKNLAMALACEVGELLEIYRWVDGEPSRRVVEDPNQRRAVADELADIAVLLLNLSLSTGIDLSDAIRDKMIRNAQKYPAPTPAVDSAHREDES